MGLAASQARLLFITRRQSDVEMGMMKNSNATLALSRQQSAVTSQANAMKAATKLEFKGNEITYDNLMGNAAAASGNMMMLTDYNTGGVILNNSLASIATATMNTGSNPNGKGASEAQQKAFVAQASGVDAAKVNELWGTSSVSSEEAEGDTFDPANSELTIEAINAYLGDFATGFINAVGEPTFTKPADLTFNTNSFTKDYAALYNLNEQQVTAHTGVITINTTFASLVSRATGTDFEDSELSATAKSKLKGMADGVIAKVPKEYQAAISKAQSTVEARWTAGATDVPGDNYNSNNMETFLKRNAKESFCCVKQRKKNSHDRKYAACWDNMSDHFISELSKELSKVVPKTGASGSEVYTISSKPINKKGYIEAEYRTELQKYWNNNCKPEESETSANTNNNSDATNESKVKFYKKMATEIASKGFIAPGDDKLTSENIQQQLVNGMYRVNGSNASNTTGFKEVDDEEAIEAAEDWKEEQLSKLNVKEKQLSTELTTLNSEYSALTTEYNSAKALIDKNIERTFTMFQ